MDSKPYATLSDLELLELCVWREARGEPEEGQRGVAHVIKNRMASGIHWWGTDLRSIILHKYQFSSFNVSDPNSDKWPEDDDAAFQECCAVAMGVYTGADEDPTDGAVDYFDTSISWPHAWGDPAGYDNTLNVGRLRFYKPKLKALTA